MNLKSVLAAFEKNALTLRPAVFFNVEGGDAVLATEYFEWCDSCLEYLGPTSSSCEECGRAPGKFLRVPAGDGDGERQDFIVTTQTVIKQCLDLGVDPLVIDSE